jgi:hypothetical protein
MKKWVKKIIVVFFVVIQFKIKSLWQEPQSQPQLKSQKAFNNLEKTIWFWPMTKPVDIQS